MRVFLKDVYALVENRVPHRYDGGPERVVRETFDLIKVARPVILGEDSLKERFKRGSLRKCSLSQHCKTLLYEPVGIAIVFDSLAKTKVILLVVEGIEYRPYAALDDLISINIAAVQNRGIVRPRNALKALVVGQGVNTWVELLPAGRLLDV